MVKNLPGLEKNLEISGSHVSPAVMASVGANGKVAVVPPAERRMAVGWGRDRGVVMVIAFRTRLPLE